MTTPPTPHIDRRTLLGGLASAPLFGLGAPALAAGKRPNILFISIDDLNDWTGVLGGHPQASTPHLDALAASGRNFRQAHCNAPVCNPSRTAVLSGLAPHVSGVYGNQSAWWKGIGDAPTLPALLRTVGYRTLGAGKVFHFGDRSAWDDYMGDPCEKVQGDEGVHPTKARHGRAGELNWGPARSDQPGIHPDQKVAQWVAEQLAKPHQQPFFLGCGFYKPHLAWYTPRRFYDARDLDEVVLPEVPDDELDDIPPIGRRLAHIETHQRIIQKDAWKEAVRAYLAAVSFADQQLGRVLSALKTSGRAHDTIVIVWSDHGWSLGEKFHWKKHALWEECTRVPLVVAGPGVEPGVCDRVVSLCDLYPTVARLCGAVPHSRVAGHDLAPLLMHPAVRWDHPCLTSQGPGNHAIRTERWRYIRYEDGTEELYDHHVDAGEHVNLAGRPEAADVLARLRPLIPTDVAPPAPDLRNKCRPRGG
mgnify:FL=1